MTINDVPKTDFIKTENGTHTFLYFSSTHASTSQAIIQGTSAIPEFPSTMILPLFFVISMLAAAFAKHLGEKSPR